jgi:hypothetical protein
MLLELPRVTAETSAVLEQTQTETRGYQETSETLLQAKKPALGLVGGSAARISACACQDICRSLQFVHLNIVKNVHAWM